MTVCSLEERVCSEDKPETFDGVVQEHGQFIRRTLAQLGVSARDLSDVEQEVFRGINRGLATFDPALASNPASAMRGWLFGICERQAASHRRSEHRRSEILLANEDLDITRSAAPNVEEKLLEAERKELLFELLATLEPQRRAVIVAYELEGISMQEVAAGMSIPVNTAWNRLRLAREDLRAAWRRLDAQRRYNLPVPILDVDGQLRELLSSLRSPDALPTASPPFTPFSPALHALAGAAAPAAVSLPIMHAVSIAAGVFVIGGAAGASAHLASTLDWRMRSPHPAVAAFANPTSSPLSSAEAPPEAPAAPPPSSAEASPVNSLTEPTAATSSSALPGADPDAQRENALILTASNALKANQLEAASRALEAHRRAFPTARTARKRELMFVDLLMRQRKAVEAQKHAQ
jgi:RNA polymerase sigma factor (sigma-70 family)